MSEKLQKVLARIGIGSRRKMEEWIKAGRVSVNGQTAQLGDRVDNSAQIKVDDRLVVSDIPIELRVLAFNKPEGLICSRDDPAGRPTVFSQLPPLPQGRWVAVGRLDLNSAGLLLFTNVGELANRLMHPSHLVEREYRIRVNGELRPDQIHRLLSGVRLSDGVSRIDRLEPEPSPGQTNRWYRAVLHRGRQREVRRLFKAMGLEVSRLIRVRYGNIVLSQELKPGHWKELGKDQIHRLTASVGLDEKMGDSSDAAALLNDRADRTDRVGPDLLGRGKAPH